MRGGQWRRCQHYTQTKTTPVEFVEHVASLCLLPSCSSAFPSTFPSTEDAPTRVVGRAAMFIN